MCLPAVLPHTHVVYMLGMENSTPSLTSVQNTTSSKTCYLSTSDVYDGRYLAASM